ncbi:hypothetical protein D9757_003830 [Collybiopsis confluens]|uniref:Uncharacterized protein n=1 Tax=Collybiopsis confluens TaxID=2823264 RepID=A0A8H5HVD6_9AGAR|nr:hypothetical protein D9757_003830 [Collybiopsis confluens]
MTLGFSVVDRSSYFLIFYLKDPTVIPGSVVVRRDAFAERAEATVTPLPKSEVLLESMPDALRFHVPHALPKSTTQVHTKQGKHKNLFDFDANKTSDTIEIHADNPHGEQREKLSDSSSIPTSGKSEVHFGVYTYYLTDISRNQINKNLVKVPPI